MTDFPRLIEHAFPLKQDIAEGQVNLDRLVDPIASQQNLIEKLQKQCEELQEKIDSNNPPND